MIGEMILSFGRLSAVKMNLNLKASVAKGLKYAEH